MLPGTASAIWLPKRRVIIVLAPTVPPTTGDGEQAGKLAKARQWGSCRRTKDHRRAAHEPTVPAYRSTLRHLAMYRPQTHAVDRSPASISSIPPCRILDAHGYATCHSPGPSLTVSAVACAETLGQSHSLRPVLGQGPLCLCVSVLQRRPELCVPSTSFGVRATARTS